MEFHTLVPVYLKRERERETSTCDCLVTIHIEYKSDPGLFNLFAPGVRTCSDNFELAH